MTPDEFRQFRSKCQELGDYELDCFAVLATTTALHEGSLLPRKWPDVYNLDGDLPYIMVPATKNGEPKPAVLSDEAIEALKRLWHLGVPRSFDPAARRDHEVLAMLEMREKIVSSRGARRLWHRDRGSGLAPYRAAPFFNSTQFFSASAASAESGCRRRTSWNSPMASSRRPRLASALPRLKCAAT
jgi:hypothetical protein